MFRGHLINILANSFDQCAFLFSQSVDDGTVFGLVVVHNEKKKDVSAWPSSFTKSAILWHNSW